MRQRHAESMLLISFIEILFAPISVLYLRYIVTFNSNFSSYGLASQCSCRKVLETSVERNALIDSSVARTILIVHISSHTLDVHRIASSVL